MNSATLRWNLSSEYRRSKLSSSRRLFRCFSIPVIHWILSLGRRLRNNSTLEKSYETNDIGRRNALNVVAEYRGSSNGDVYRRQRNRCTRTESHRHNRSTRGQRSRVEHSRRRGEWGEAWSGAGAGRRIAWYGVHLDHRA